MSDSALITIEENLKDGIGLYLHWCGDIQTVTDFLVYCDLKRYRSPDTHDYGWSCLSHVISSYFGDGLSVGIVRMNRWDGNSLDNGIYIIKNWKIIKRKYGNERKKVKPSLKRLKRINECMPVKERLSDERLSELLEKYLNGENLGIRE